MKQISARAFRLGFEDLSEPVLVNRREKERKLCLAGIGQKPTPKAVPQQPKTAPTPAKTWWQRWFGWVFK